MSYEQAMPTSSVTPTAVTALPITAAVPIAAAEGGDSKVHAHGGNMHLHNHNTMVATPPALEGAGPITAISTAIAGGPPKVEPTAQGIANTEGKILNEVKHEEKQIAVVDAKENLILQKLGEMDTKINNIASATANAKAIGGVMNCNLGSAMHEKQFPHDKGVLSQTPPGMKIPTP